MHVNASLRYCIDPSANDAMALKYKLMWAVAIDKGEFKIIAKRGG